MKTRAIQICIIAFFAIISVNGQEVKQCSGSGVNVRQTPSSDGAVAGKLQQGDFVYVYKDSPHTDFLKIDYQGAEAYVSKQFLKEIGLSNSSKMDIPAITSVISKSDRGIAWEKYAKKASLTQNEKNELKIDKLECVSSKKKLVNGKSIFKTTQGRLETIISVIEDHAVFEYLVSYDSKGNIIDCLEVGTIMCYAGDNCNAFIEGDKILLRYTWCESEECGCTYTFYQITPELKFKEMKKWGIVW